MRALVARDYAQAFEQVDAIVGRCRRFRRSSWGEKLDDPVAMYLSDIYTITGRPGRDSVHERAVREDAEGLPVGLQIFTRHFDEAEMFRLADAFERAAIHRRLERGENTMAFTVPPLCPTLPTHWSRISTR